MMITEPVTSNSRRMSMLLFQGSYLIVMCSNRPAIPTTAIAAAAPQRPFAPLDAAPWHERQDDRDDQSRFGALSCSWSSERLTSYSNDLNAVG